MTDTKLYRVRTTGDAPETVIKGPDGLFVAIPHGEVWDSDGNNRTFRRGPSLNLATLTPLHLLSDAELQARDKAAVKSALENFDNADWFWRTMDPDDCADSPGEAVNRSMIGNFCVCEIASSFSGPKRYGFTAPVLGAESDDDEFLYFATQQEAIDAAKERADAIRAMKGTKP